ncbi:unnamed protein product [Rhizophagus irregularis]|nr:hypothetical protein RhiirA4_467274 [Rhizophagus irregularis]CAB4421848.1 unnamed protein product [Rhizophagus irregularis]CAB4422067.1 unnamed protein product [Rhizophagus irregularis]
MSESWIELVMPCPTDTCMMYANDRPLIYWGHVVCNGASMEISDEANIRCTECGYKNFMTFFTFQCSRKEHNGKFEAASYNVLRAALVTALEHRDSDSDVIRRLYKFVNNNKYKFQ